MLFLRPPRFVDAQSRMSVSTPPRELLGDTMVVLVCLSGLRWDGRQRSGRQDSAGSLKKDHHSDSRCQRVYRTRRSSLDAMRSSESSHW